MSESKKETRQAHWSEIGETEKCRRLRQMVKVLQKRVAVLEVSVSELQHHDHTQQGLVVPLRTGPVECCVRREGTGLSDDVFF